MSRLPVLAWALFGFLAASNAAAQWLDVRSADDTRLLRVWGNDGGDKVLREETRALTDGLAANTLNRTFDGTAIRLFAARNEVVSFALIVENGGAATEHLRLQFDRLEGATAELVSQPASGAELFTWTERPIEVFAVGYLPVHGLSRISYDLYDETHVPSVLQRSYVDYQPVAPAVGEGGWQDRPAADRSFPDIAVPQEVQGSSAIAVGESQTFWVDVYVPKTLPPGTLLGTARLQDDTGATVLDVPVALDVLDLTLPDTSPARTMLYIESRDIGERYFTGAGQPFAAEDAAAYRAVVDRHFQLAWRHGVSLIDANEPLPDAAVPTLAPNADWQARLAGELYTAQRGYAGPGAGLGHDVYSIGTYSSWTWWWNLRAWDPVSDVFDASLPIDDLRAPLTAAVDAWESWFRDNAPAVDRFLYVDDEPEASIEFAEHVARFVSQHGGVGGDLDTLVTANPVLHGDTLQSPSIFASLFAVAPTTDWQLALENHPDRRQFMYNGKRPATGSFATDDDGVALRQLAWGQYKLGVERWFYWHGTYYNNVQGGAASRDLSAINGGGADYRAGSRTNLFRSAHTFGGHDRFDPVIGETGWNYSNGDGVLFYPGTDRVFPAYSLNLPGPLASLRLKHWRRGIQDAKYLQLAAAVAPEATSEIVAELVPEALWEVGVHDPADPTFVHKAPSWPTDPDRWEAARRELADLIQGSPEALPDILEHPASASVAADTQVTFQVLVAASPPASVQWLHDGVELAGADQPRLTLIADATSAGAYQARVSNRVGAVLSNVATLTVTEPDRAPQILSEPVSQVAPAGSLVQLAVEASGQPAPDYQWWFNGAPLADARSAQLNLVVGPDTVGDYQVAVSNRVGSVGSAVARVALPEAPPPPPPAPPEIVLQPQSLESALGTEIVLRVAAQGVPAPAYQWQRNGVDLPGASAEELRFVLTRERLGNYRVRIANSAGLTLSATAVVSAPLDRPPLGLVVGDPEFPGEGDRAVLDLLQGDGYAVHLFDDAAATTASTASATALLISASVGTGQLKGRLRDDPRPILLWETFLFDEMRLTGAVRGVDAGNQAVQQQLEVRSRHPITAGAAGDLLAVTSRSEKFGWGVPGGGAEVLAALAGDPARAALFLYPPDAVLADGSRAAGWRGGTFLKDFTAAHLTATGRALLLRTVHFLTGVQSAPPADTRAPELTAFAVTGADELTLTFDGALDPATAVVPEFYGVDQDVLIVAVELLDGNRVRLTTSGLAVDTDYRLNVAGVTDLAGNRADFQYAFSTAPPPVAQFSLVVGDPTAPGAGDSAILARLRELGHQVLLHDDDSVSLAATASSDVVLISASVKPNRIRQRFRDDSRPVMLWEPILFDDMGLTGPERRVDFGTIAAQIGLALYGDDTTGIGAEAGLLDVVDSPVRFSWGRPGAASRRIAHLINAPQRAVAFAYRRGDPLADASTASGARLAWYFHVDSAARWTPHGRELFDRAILWLQAEAAP